MPSYPSVVRWGSNESDVKGTHAALPLRNTPSESKPAGFQPVVARCHDYRGRSGCPVDPDNGELQQQTAQNCEGATCETDRDEFRLKTCFRATLDLVRERLCCMNPTGPRISPKILLVDDDDAIREMMTATLEHKGFAVVAVANVTEALKLITTETFDVLITDLHMPNPTDGFAVITVVRDIEA